MYGGEVLSIFLVCFHTLLSLRVGSTIYQARLRPWKMEKNLLSNKCKIQEDIQW